jgi:hypothetical protein
MCLLVSCFWLIIPAGNATAATTQDIYKNTQEGVTNCLKNEGVNAAKGVMEKSISEINYKLDRLEKINARVNERMTPKLHVVSLDPVQRQHIINMRDKHLLKTTNIINDCKSKSLKLKNTIAAINVYTTGENVIKSAIALDNLLTDITKQEIEYEKSWDPFLRSVLNFTPQGSIGLLVTDAVFYKLNDYLDYRTSIDAMVIEDTRKMIEEIGLYRKELYSVAYMTSFNNLSEDQAEKEITKFNAQLQVYEYDCLKRIDQIKGELRRDPKYLDSILVTGVTDRMAGISYQSVTKELNTTYDWLANADFFQNNVKIMQKGKEDGNADRAELETLLKEIETLGGLNNDQELFNQVKFIVSDTSYYLDNTSQPMGVSPFAENGTILVPVRYLASGLGAYIRWGKDDQSLTIKKDDQTYKFKVGDKHIYKVVDGKEMSDNTKLFNTHPVLIKGLFYIPIEAANFLGYSVSIEGQTASVVNNPVRPLSINDFTIGNIKLYMPRNQVLQALGPPQNVITKLGMDQYIQLDYPGLQIDTFDYTSFTEVCVIEIISPNFSTPRGLKVGDLKTKVIQLYGQPTEQDENTLIYRDPTSEEIDSSCGRKHYPRGISIELKDDVVVKISLFDQGW